MIITKAQLLKEFMDLDTLKVKETLNPKIWDKHGKINTEVLRALRLVAEDFYKSLNVDIEIADIIFTGSLANYNWSNQSDVDLHLVIDFNKLYETLKPNEHYEKEEFLKDFFSDKTKLWNDSHTMTMYGHPVEVYVQDTNEKHVSTGVFSVKNNKWIQTPSHLNANPDFKFIRKKAKHIMDLIDDVARHKDIKAIDKLKDKLKAFRKRGLDADGEMSNSNLVYKVLRREGYLDKLYKLKDTLFDKQTTVK